VSRAERSSVELAQDIVHEAHDLIQLEIQLARQEVEELARRNGIAAALLTFGGLLVVLALLVALPVLVVLSVDNHVLAAAIWLAIYVVVGAVLLLVGRLLLRLELPPRTIASLEETKAWVLRQIRSHDR